MIAVLSATWSEIYKLSREIQAEREGAEGEVSYISGELYGLPAVLAVTGVGIKRARAGASLVVQKFSPSLIIYTGLSGALDPKLRIGDIVLGRSIVSLRKNESKALGSSIKENLRGFIEGPILTENRFIHTAELKNELFSKSRALVVDMESWGAAQALEQSATPLICVRVVSDTAFEKLPDMGAVYGSSGGVEISKAFPYFLGNPGMLIPYFKFRFISSKKSTHALHCFLRELIAQFAA